MTRLHVDTASGSSAGAAGMRLQARGVPYLDVGTRGGVAWLKTSGGKGLHVVVPLTPRDDWETVKGFAQAVVQHLTQVIPQRFTARMGAANRVGKLFVDVLRNNHGATTAAAFSARSRPGLGVSIPLAWDDLTAVKRSDQWNLRTAREHLSFQSRSTPGRATGPASRRWRRRSRSLAFQRRIEQ